jgi:hypothetical protein
MSSDSAGIRDSVEPALNPDDMDQLTPTGEQAPPVPPRPADGATKATWTDYLVALGAEEEALAGRTEHWNGDEYEPAKDLTRDELIELADRLGS